MSRSGYSEDLDQWELIRWRGAVASAIKGKRGQAFLKELEDALLALPEKKLIVEEFVQDGQVCTLGAIAVAREIQTGLTREAALKKVEETFDPDDHEGVAARLQIPSSLAQELMYLNDKGNERVPPEKVYQEMLTWVQGALKKS